MQQLPHWVQENFSPCAYHAVEVAPPDMTGNSIGRIISPAAVVVAVFLTDCASGLCATATTGPTTLPLRTLVYRSDLADAYLEVELLLREKPPAPAIRAAVNREFDQATVQFFRGGYPETIRRLHEVCDILNGSPPSGDARVARSLRVRAAPIIAQRNRPSLLRVAVSPMYRIEGVRAGTWRVAIAPTGAKDSRRAIFTCDIELDPDGPTPTVLRAQPDAPPGAYDVWLTAPDGASHRAGRW
ncbi:MAG: hypothetical protein ACREJC_00275, partial [Tepidisphaeraceae bacterium]